MNNTLHKTCENTGFHWPLFSRIRKKSAILSLYRRIRVSENPWSWYILCSDLTSKYEKRVKYSYIMQVTRVSQTSNIDRFSKATKLWNLLNIFTKSSILNAWLGSEWHSIKAPEQEYILSKYSQNLNISEIFWVCYTKNNFPVLFIKNLIFWRQSKFKFHVSNQTSLTLGSKFFNEIKENLHFLIRTHFIRTLSLRLPQIKNNLQTMTRLDARNQKNFKGEK